MLGRIVGVVNVDDGTSLCVWSLWVVDVDGRRRRRVHTLGVVDVDGLGVHGFTRLSCFGRGVLNVCGLGSLGVLDICVLSRGRFPWARRTEGPWSSDSEYL